LGERPALIRVRGATKVYRAAEGDVTSLTPLDFDIREGEFLSVVGPSGCGKSTLLKMVGGLLPASGGVIEIAGQAVNGPAAGIGIVFQSHVLLAWRTVLENIMLQIEVRKLPRDTGMKQARALIDMVGLAGFEGKYPWQLSGGMQQRTSLCRALIHEPELLLLDEPFGALDAFTREELWVVLQDLWLKQKFTVILVTHDLTEAVYLADTVHVCSKRPGRIVRSQPIDLPRPRDIYAPEFVSLVRSLKENIVEVRAA